MDCELPTAQALRTVPKLTGAQSRMMWSTHTLLVLHVSPTQQSGLPVHVLPPVPQLVVTSSHFSVAALHPPLQQSASAVQAAPLGTHAFPHLPSLPHTPVQH